MTAFSPCYRAAAPRSCSMSAVSQPEKVQRKIPAPPTADKGARRHTIVAVPTGWLIALMAALVLPWLAVAGIYVDLPATVLVAGLAAAALLGLGGVIAYAVLRPPARRLVWPPHSERTTA